MIRIMEIDDIYQVVTLEKKIFKESLGYNFFENELTINPFAKYFVYEINKEIVAYIGSRIYDNSLEIMNFLVIPRVQRQGIGSSLLNYLINNFNINEVTLEVRKSNKQALSFYKKEGFVLSHVKKEYYGNEDGYLLMKEVIK